MCEDFRICSVCGRKMYSGYVVGDSEYYCSDECLHEHHTDEEYLEMYESDDAYWTEWG